MNLKTKIFILVALSLFSVSLVTLPAVTTAFASDSFSQKVGDQYIWELKVAPPGSDLNIWKVGDQLKIVISAANKTMIGPVLWDILWGTMYNNSAANRTWQLLQPTDIICYYNNTKGWYLGDMYAYMFMFIPHNQTTVNFEKVISILMGIFSQLSTNLAQKVNIYAGLAAFTGANICLTIRGMRTAYLFNDQFMFWLILVLCLLGV